MAEAMGGWGKAGAARPPGCGRQPCVLLSCSWSDWLEEAAAGNSWRPTGPPCCPCPPAAARRLSSACRRPGLVGWDEAAAALAACCSCSCENKSVAYDFWGEEPGVVCRSVGEGRICVTTFDRWPTDAPNHAACLHSCRPSAPAGLTLSTFGEAVELVSAPSSSGCSCRGPRGHTLLVGQRTARRAAQGGGRPGRVRACPAARAAVGGRLCQTAAGPAAAARSQAPSETHQAALGGAVRRSCRRGRHSFDLGHTLEAPPHGTAVATSYGCCCSAKFGHQWQEAIAMAHAGLSPLPPQLSHSALCWRCGGTQSRNHELVGQRRDGRGARALRTAGVALP